MGHDVCPHCWAKVMSCMCPHPSLNQTIDAVSNGSLIRPVLKYCKRPVNKGIWLFTWERDDLSLFGHSEKWEGVEKVLTTENIKGVRAEIDGEGENDGCAGRMAWKMIWDQGHGGQIFVEKDYCLHCLEWHMMMIIEETKLPPGLVNLFCPNRFIIQMFPFSHFNH